jgi:hypothetical protein
MVLAPRIDNYPFAIGVPTLLEIYDFVYNRLVKQQGQPVNSSRKHLKM